MKEGASERGREDEGWGRVQAMCRVRDWAIHPSKQFHKPQELTAHIHLAMCVWVRDERKGIVFNVSSFLRFP